jgi:hypothetical protein
MTYLEDDKGRSDAVAAIGELQSAYTIEALQWALRDTTVAVAVLEQCLGAM